MKKFLYIEILRQVCPVQKYEDFRFFLLGGFDAMQIYSGDSISELKRQYEAGQKNEPSLFDRQPLFLYSDTEMENIDTDEGVFSQCGKYESYPLVMTLFQIDKVKLSKDVNHDSPDRLIQQFTNLLETEIQTTPGEEILYRTFWNLGESDLVVVFRTKTLKQIADVLHRLRMKVYQESDVLQVISTCSHCAFPKPRGLDSMPDSKKAKKIEMTLKKWIDEEFKENSSSEFISLVNTSAGFNSMPYEMKLLFGEWDYMFYQNIQGREEVISFLKDIFLVLVQKQKNNGQEFPFRISYSIPAIQSVEMKPDGKDKRKNIVPLLEPEWMPPLITSMDSLCERILSAFKKDEKKGQDFADTIHSFQSSIAGLGKFLYRLKTGRFEDDLYIYIKPVFVRLRFITDNFSTNIDELTKSGAYEQIDRLIREYISDTSDLVEKLQHLFSIMAVSPHTFMETYGSNMRSLSASDKLLDAYQGIASFLKKHFPDKIGRKRTCREILVLPYRKTQSTHTLLYQQSSPMNRISYIQIDFTKMFDIQSSVFMLLHECGHHLGDRLRKERFKCYTQSAIAMTFEIMGMDNYLIDPVLSFLSRANSIDTEEMRELEGARVFNHDSRLEQTYSEAISTAVQDAIHDLVDYYSSDVILMYQEMDAEYPFLQELKENYYGEQVIQCICEKMIPYILSYTRNGFTTNEQVSIYEKAEKDLIRVVKETVGCSLKKIAEELSDSIIKKNGNIREALRLKTIYADEELLAENLVRNRKYSVEEKMNRGAYSALFSVFSDIHSDIFAITILNIGPEEYTQIFPRLLGIDISDLSLGINSLYRVFTVIKTIWPLAKPEELLTKLTVDSDLQKEIAREWRDFSKHSYCGYLETYAKKCYEKMLYLIDNIKKNPEQDSLDMLNRMFLGDTQQQMNAVFHFYQYLMKGGSR